MSTNDAKERENDFVKSFKALAGIEFNENNKIQLIKTLANIGGDFKGLFEETDTFKLRAWLSQLITTGNSYGVDSPSEYIGICITLLTYIEYLEHSKDFHDLQSSTNQNRDKMGDSLIIAYYLSRFNKEALVKLGYTNFNSAFEAIGHMLKQKPATIKNMRDVFDPFFNNGRVGWYQRPLAGSRKEIFERYASASFDEMSSLVSTIIKAYSSQQENTNKRRKIKINGNAMREITSKRMK